MLFTNRILSKNGNAVIGLMHLYVFICILLDVAVCLKHEQNEEMLSRTSTLKKEKDSPHANKTKKVLNKRELKINLADKKNGIYYIDYDHPYSRKESPIPVCKSFHSSFHQVQNFLLIIKTTT